LISLSFKLLPHWIIDNVSSFHIALTCYHLHDRRQSLPQWNYFASPVELDPFPRWIRVPLLLFSLPQSGHLCHSPVNVTLFSDNKSLSLVIPFSTRFKVLHSHLHHKHSRHLRSKIVYSVFKSLHSRHDEDFNLRLFGWRNLNRGICHTPIFDLRCHLIFICHTLNFVIL
jgi:hypothetical protein